MADGTSDGTDPPDNVIVLPTRCSAERCVLDRACPWYRSPRLGSPFFPQHCKRLLKS